MNDVSAQQKWNVLPSELLQYSANWEASVQKIAELYPDETSLVFEATKHNKRWAADIAALVPLVLAMRQRPELLSLYPQFDKREITLSLLSSTSYPIVTDQVRSYPLGADRYEVVRIRRGPLDREKTIERLGEGDAEQAADLVAALVRQVQQTT